MERSSRRHRRSSRGLAGFALCVVLSLLSMKKLTIFQQYSDADAWDVIHFYPSLNLGSTSQSLWIAKNESSVTALRDNGSDDSTKTGFRTGIPRVVVLSTAHPQTISTRSIFHDMIFLLNENNPLSYSKDSSARMKSTSIKRKESLAIRVLGIGDEDESGMLYSELPIMELPGKAELISIAGKEQLYREFEKDWYEKCIPVTEDKSRMHKSTKKESKSKNRQRPIMHVRSTCNTFHELDIVDGYTVSEEGNGGDEDRSRIELLGEGSWRSVWRLVESIVSSLNTNNGRATIANNGNAGGVVLKLLLMHHQFDENSYSIHELDALVMEALSASKYVVNSYGFCGQSVLTAAAQESGRSLIKRREFQWIDRIRIARDLARGLADLHAFHAHDYGQEPDPNNKNSYGSRHPSPLPLVFAHHDVNPANLIAVHPRQIQWNDFNLGLINRYYNNDVEMYEDDNYAECPMPIRYEQLLWRSPEECHNQTGTLMLDLDGSGRNTAAQAADVYSLGNILFYVLARHQPWSHLEEENQNSTAASAKLDTGSTPEKKRDSLLGIGRAKVSGQLPNLPDRYFQRKEAKILWKAIHMCYEHDPKLRSTALEIANVLGDAYKTLYTKYHDNGKFEKKG